MIEFFLRLILAIFGRCGHRGGLAYGWPTRRVDGQDWQACTECGHERLSPLQFNTHRKENVPTDEDVESSIRSGYASVQR